jgi:hypothetical protein
MSSVVFLHLFLAIFIFESSPLLYTYLYVVSDFFRLERMMLTCYLDWLLSRSRRLVVGIWSLVSYWTGFEVVFFPSHIGSGLMPRDIVVKTGCLRRRYHTTSGYKTCIPLLLVVSKLLVTAVFFYPQNYWISGLCPSSGILSTRKHNI